MATGVNHEFVLGRDIFSSVMASHSITVVVTTFQVVARLCILSFARIAGDISIKEDNPANVVLNDVPIDRRVLRNSESSKTDHQHLGNLRFKGLIWHIDPLSQFYWSKKDKKILCDLPHFQILFTLFHLHFFTFSVILYQREGHKIGVSPF